MRIAVIAAIAVLMGAAPARAGWQTYSASSGLGGNLVWGLFEDRAGNLWVHAENGVSRFDGVRWTRIPFTGPGSNSPMLGTGVDDGAGHIWFRLPDGGLARFDGERIRPVTTADGLVADTLTAFLVGPSGDAWAGSADRGVSHWDGSHWTVTNSTNGLADDQVTTMHLDRHGVLWVGSQVGPSSRHDASGWTALTNSGGVSRQEVAAIYEMRNGDLWFKTVGTSEGLTRFDGMTWQTYWPSYPDIFARRLVSDLKEDSTGAVWAITYSQSGNPGSSELQRFDGASWTMYTGAELPSPYVSLVFADRDAIWLQTSNPQCSIVRFSPTGSREVTTDDGLPACPLSDLAHSLNACFTHDGEIWIGSYAGGVGRWNGKIWHHYGTADGLAGNRVDQILEDHLGNLWFAAEGGLSRFDRAGWKTTVVAPAPIGAPAMFSHDRIGRLWGTTYAQHDLALIYSGSSDSAGVSALWDTLQVPAPVSGVAGLFEDRAGGFWFGGQGAARYWNGSWTTYTAASTGGGLPDDNVTAMLEDHLGRMWFGTYSKGVARLDSGIWKNYSTATGLPSNQIYALVEDRLGRVWIGHDAGLSVFDGNTITSYTTANGLPYDRVLSIVEDQDGAMWFGTIDGLSRFANGSWTTFNQLQGLADGRVYWLSLDRAGHVWAGTGGGLSEYLDGRWHTWTQADGMVESGVDAVIEDGIGDIWVTTYSGASIYSPDHIPARAVVVSAPPPVSSSRFQSVTFLPALGESRVEFQLTFDGLQVGAWSDINNWSENNLADGVHELTVHARDVYGNADPQPSVVRFEVDASPPEPRIISPGAGAVVRGMVAIAGSTSDARFSSYTMRIRRGPANAPAFDSLFANAAVPVAAGTLGSLDTRALPDGDYELVLAVRDTLGLVGGARVGLTVDNLPPFASVTSPVVLDAAKGGDVFTADGGVHLYFPPHALDRDTEVRIDTVAVSRIPAQAPDGAQVTGMGRRVSWQGAPLAKAITLGIARSAAEADAAIYQEQADGSWSRIGGSPDGRFLSAAVKSEGLYAMFTGGAAVSGGASLSDLTLTPRALSLNGRFSGRDVAIGFTLGRAASATVRVYNRAGRLIQTVADRVSFGAGSNLVRWDGRDRDGAMVGDGLYLVSVEALDVRKTETLAVVR